jgi:hypothetical protein
VDPYRLSEWIVLCLDDNGEPTSGFTQREWFLPSSQILVIDQTDTPGLPGLLNHASWH